MPECDSLVAGAGLIGIGILLLYQSTRGSFDTRLIASLPISRCGRVLEGMVKTTGRAVGTAHISSPMLGLPCLVTQVEVEAYEGSGDDGNWKRVHQGSESTSFYVEDETGRVWVDPSNAEFLLQTDVEYSTAKKWKPQPGHLVKFGERELTRELLETSVRSFYEQRTARAARKKKLRFTEKNLMPGNTVTILGPAFAVPPGASGAGEVRIHKVHPDDPFVIGDGAPEELAERMQKRVWWRRVAAFGCMAVGAAMIVSCFLERGR